ncbi:hypothetical protein HDV00_001894 [Rhizophlyctis rosea]|nr:hypothetical protein HDV00_001894 [Rhizophlyctis rosea]
MVLRKANRPLPRGELIPAVLRLDEELSKERGLPRLFRGKTPQNTASAILTENRDSLFIPVDIPGAKKQHFKLAYEPGNFESALENYNTWMKLLIENDWPILFHPYLRDSKGGAVQTAGVEASAAEGSGGAADVLSNESGNDVPQNGGDGGVGLAGGAEQQNASDLDDGEMGPMSPSKKRKREEIDKENGNKKLAVAAGDGCQALPESGAHTIPQDVAPEPTMNAEVKSDVEVEGKDEVADTSPSGPSVAFDPDLYKDVVIPKSLDEVVEVRKSTISGAGRGLFAKRHLFPETILGFYFGVPMTEDDFDSSKDRVGVASQYSHRYRRTILDATDDNGQPFYNHPRLFCPFHFMNEDSTRANMGFLEGAKVNQVICYTLREIQPGEELFANYGKDVDRHWTEASPAVEGAGGD